MAVKTIEKPKPRVHGVSRAREHNCLHHWRIESPNGPTSMGRCKHCGAERHFPNSSEDSIWDGAEG